ncbi:MAG: bifunctional nuclease family protein [Halarchaeum sp.]
MDATIGGVKVAGTADGPVPVVLVNADGRGSVLPIFIAFEEALSIARGVDAEGVGRPLTHDLTLDIVEELGGRLDHVVIRDVEDGTYFADLYLQTPRGEAVVDARPSDSLALAARTDAPIRVAASVFESGRRDRDAFDDLRDIREVAQ